MASGDGQFERAEAIGAMQDVEVGAAVGQDHRGGGEIR